MTFRIVLGEILFKIDFFTIFLIKGIIGLKLASQEWFNNEKPIEGISSQSILDKINNTNKVLLDKNDIRDLLSNDDHELVISMGAGDIGELVESIKKTIIDQNES